MGDGGGRCKPEPCSQCAYARKCLLATLMPDERSAWTALPVVKSFRKGEILFWEEGEPEGLYLVCAGAVKLLKSVGDGDQQILRLVGPGCFFGLPPLVSRKTHFCTCQAIARTHIRFIPRERFLGFLESFPRFAFRLVDQLAGELRLARLRLLDFGHKTGRQRIADLLLWLGEEFGEATPEGIAIRLELTRADLAGMAGLTTETTIRILSALRCSGMIATGRWKRIVLLDRNQLQTITGCSQPPDFGRAWPD